MPASDIVIKGAREHNLQNVDLILPRNKLICLTGVSGSGKSSMAFDTIFAEGQRRYIESLSTFARQFLGQMPKPDVDLIQGLSPAISISQKATGSNPRSTVGTVTEIYDFLRVLFARIGHGYCPRCDQRITAQTREQIINQILTLPKGTKFSVLAPVIKGQKGEHQDLLEDLLKQGFVRARIDGQIYSLNDDPQLDRNMRHHIEVVIDRLVAKPDQRARLAEAVELGIKLGGGSLIVAIEPVDLEDTEGEKLKTQDWAFSTDYACVACGISFASPTPQLFSFNSPQGMCTECLGLGEKYTFDPDLLVPDPTLSIKEGAFVHLGVWKELGRWRRHILQGVADTLERVHNLEAGFLLDSPWSKVPQHLKDCWLYGTGKTHITFTWRSGSAPVKYGGTFEGLVPELNSKYRSTKSKPHKDKMEQLMKMMGCPSCHGTRLNEQARSIRLTSKSPAFREKARLSLPDVCGLSIRAAGEFFEELELSPTETLIATEALKEIRSRLGFLINVGLDYLKLDRTAPTLSGGETQRIRLASQIGCGLVGVLYILDEPSIGLHPRDNDRLIETLCRLRDIGNTVVVVEHDEDTMRAADHIVDFGPGPGVRGGQIVAEGTPEEFAANPASLTAAYLTGREKIEIPAEHRSGSGNFLRVLGATHNNLKDVDVSIPLGTFVCITGVSGSGKSSLINDILVEALNRDLNRGNGTPGAHRAIEGLEHLDKLIAIDQSPIGRTPRSNPGTYIKVFDEIRDLFAQMPEAKKRGYQAGRFSFNVEGGRCSACEGNGANKLEMDFLADIWVTCPVCEGKRFNRETLQVKFKDYSIADVLEMDIQQALSVFENVPNIYHKLMTLHNVGLDYIKIGQPSPTLSGGEAQRIKLARELVKKSTGKTLYLLDEPTTGLHFADVKLLLKVLHDFAAAGNTVLVVEHNLDVIKTADWVVDLGPEGGERGGEILAAGTPEQIAACERSYTGRALAKIFQRESEQGQAKKTKKSAAPPAKRKVAELATHITVRGASEHNLKHVSAEIARDKMTIFCGPSGSGKSSLAMDTIYAEGQRRYVESLSAYARQFVDQMQKPKLEHIEGLSPAIAIEQKNLGNTPRSTVGTVTEVYDYFRVLITRLGTPMCPTCEIAIGTQTSDEIVDKILKEPEGTRLYLLSPIEFEVGMNLESLWNNMRQHGFNRVRIDGKTYELDAVPAIDRRKKHDIQILIDRIVVKEGSRGRIADSVEAALSFGKGVAEVAYVEEKVEESTWRVVRHSQHLACDKCGTSYEQLAPHNFSFNSSLGWCPHCEGLGVQLGANPIALINDPKWTLRQGALKLWPSVSHAMSRNMLEGLAKKTGLPLDVPYESLSARWKRVLLHGTGEDWIPVFDGNKPQFLYQFKGIYPALDEASKLSVTLRTRLEQFVDNVECTTCNGSRLRADAAAYRLRGLTVDDLCKMPLGKLLETIKSWKFDRREKKIAGELIREILARVEFLTDVGLDYLSLSRPAATLSNGEAQRIRLASQLGSGLCGVLFVLDEPTIGLHPRDNTKLLRALEKLRDLGNTLLVVEHDREVIEAADYIFDFGPEAGRNGGQIVAEGAPAALAKKKGSVTGPYIADTKSIPIPSNRRFVARVNEVAASSTKKSGKGSKSKGSSDSTEINPMKLSGFGSGSGRFLEVVGARHNNLKGIDVAIPLQTLTAITGPSGCGKSSLVEDVLYNSLAKILHRASLTPGAHDKIRGLDQINKVIRVDQQPLGNSPTSNPATYTGVFELIRQLYSQLPESRVRGFTARRFSFNAPGGRCETCEGNGQKKIEMHFLPDVWVTCETCEGKRYNPETLAVKFRDHSISDVLEMTCGDAVKLFKSVPKIRKILQTICDVGLDYVTLGQSAPTLSGGEAQRVKLAAELARPDTGRTLYLLDEPTSGLHFDDLNKLLTVLHRLVDLGNTVVLIEHNLDAIKNADWIVDMGPEAGADGGTVVVTGTPEDIAAYAKRQQTGSKQDRALPRSYTGEALLPVLERGPYEERLLYDPQAAIEEDLDDAELESTNEMGAEVGVPWEVDGRKWHTETSLDRKGEAIRWDREILKRVIGKIESSEKFAKTNWNSRSVVEVTAERASDGWFFHAITAETWMLKMKFRVPRSTFDRKQLEADIPLKTPNQLDDVPIYGNEPRVKCKMARGPWQEIEIRAYSLAELESTKFWQFLDKAIEAFYKKTEYVAVNIENEMPWKKMGAQWHLSRKGFNPGKKPAWDTDVLEDLFALVEDASPGGEFLWNQQVLVHRMIEGQREPWATIQTKRVEGVFLILRGPKDRFSLGRVSNFGFDRSLETEKGKVDLLKFEFRTVEDLHSDGFREFLEEHAKSITGG